MYGTSSYTATQTFTVVDIRKAFEAFEADLRMIARRTGARDEPWAENTSHDVQRLAELGYLREVNVVFYDQAGRKVFARRYCPQVGVSGVSERPGGNLLTYDPHGTLTVIVSYVEEWAKLSDESRKQVRSSLILSWVRTDEDITHADMRSVGSRRYGSNGYGLARDDFEACP